MHTMKVHRDRAIDFAHPERSQFHVDDLVVGMSTAPRYAGFTTEPWDVAQHTMLCLRLIPSRNEAYAFLGIYVALHDAAEAYMNDLPRPLKRLCPDYSGIEDRMMQAINGYFGVPDPDDGMLRMVHEIDQMAFDIERPVLQPGTTHVSEVTNVDVRGMAPFGRAWMDHYLNNPQRACYDLTDVLWRLKGAGKNFRWRDAYALPALRWNSV